MTVMRFFNDELFTVGKSHAAYLQYWKANRELLPDSLLRINGGMLPDDCFGTIEAVHLHDAKIRAVELQLPQVMLHLHGDHYGALREIILCYSGVTRLTPIPDRLLVESHFSDLMCHETTLVESGLFNHKMLFSSSDVLSIDFTDLDIELVDHPKPTG